MKAQRFAELRAEIGLFLDDEKAARIAIRKRLEQHAIHDREHEGRRADSEGERKQGDGSESGILTKRAQGIASVLREVLQPARAAGVAALFLHLLGAAQLEAGSPAGFGWRHAARDEIGRVLLDMESQLLFELFFQATAIPQAPPPGHSAPPSDRRRIRPTASANRRQLAASDSSRARPFRVRR